MTNHFKLEEKYGNAIGKSVSIVFIGSGATAGAEIIDNLISKKQTTKKLNALQQNIDTATTALKAGDTHTVLITPQDTNLVTQQAYIAYQTIMQNKAALKPREFSSQTIQNYAIGGTAGALLGGALFFVALAALPKKLSKSWDKAAEFCANKHMAVADYFGKDKTATPQP